MVVSIENAEHYVWGEVCDGWHLLKRDDMSVIQERVPAGGAEVMHYHTCGAPVLLYPRRRRDDGILRINRWFCARGQGIEIRTAGQTPIQKSIEGDVHFLVISVPSTAGRSGELPSETAEPNMRNNIAILI